MTRINKTILASLLMLLFVRLTAVTVLPSSRAMRHEFEANDLQTATLIAKRGSLRDRNGYNLSADLSFDSVYSDNDITNFSDPDGQAILDQEVKYLSALLGLSADDIQRKLIQRGAHAVLLKRFVSAKISKQLNGPIFFNIFTEPDIERYQPYADVSNAITGSVDNGGGGPTEYEQLFDSDLRGKSGTQTREISARYDRSGKLVKEVKALDGHSVTTTLDLPLMKTLKDALTSGQSAAVFAVDSKAPSEWQLLAYVQHDSVVLGPSDCATPPSFIPASLQFPKLFNANVRVLTSAIGTSSLTLRLGWVDQALATVGTTSSTGQVRCLTAKLSLTPVPIRSTKVCLLGQSFAAVQAFHQSSVEAVRFTAAASGARFKEVMLTTNGSSASALRLLGGGIHDTCGR